MGARLLASVLQEQRIVLVGPKEIGSAFALALQGLV